MEAEGSEVNEIVAGLQEVRKSADAIANAAGLIGRGVSREEHSRLAAVESGNMRSTLDTLIQRVQGLERNTPTANEDKLREQAVAEVLKIRGSYDAPGFDACVEAEVQTLRAKQPAIAPAELVEAVAKAFYDKKRELDGCGCSWEDLHPSRKPEWHEPSQAALAVAIPAIEAPLLARIAELEGKLKEAVQRLAAHPTPGQIRQLARELCIADGHDPDGPTCDIYVEGDPDAGVPWASYRGRAEELLVSGERHVHGEPELAEKVDDAINEVLKQEYGHTRWSISHRVTEVALGIAIPAIEAKHREEVERLHESIKAMLPWFLFYAQGKTLGEVADHCGGTIYNYSPWLTAPLHRGYHSANDKPETSYQHRNALSQPAAAESEGA